MDTRIDFLAQDLLGTFDSQRSNLIAQRLESAFSSRYLEDLPTPLRVAAGHRKARFRFRSRIITA